MIDFEVIAIAVSLISLVVSIVAIRVSAKAEAQANMIASQELQLSHGQSELLIYQMITGSRRRTEEFLENHIEFLSREASSEADKIRKEALGTLSESISEEYLNSVDIACQIYLDKKVDPVRFKRSYQRDVRRIFESDAYKTKVVDISNGYWALRKVHNEWENPEN